MTKCYIKSHPRSQIQDDLLVNQTKEHTSQNQPTNILGDKCNQRPLNST